MDTPDLNQITNLTNTQKANTQNLLAGQNTATSDYLKRYSDFINSQESSSAMASRIGSELGIPTLQNNATMLRNTLTNLPGTYSKATTGFDVNANQLARVIGQKSSELSPMVTTAENSLANANTNLNTQMGYQKLDQEKALLPYTTEKELLNDRLARETTLYTEDNSNELNGLISKIQSGITLSEGEKNRANQLAIAEAGYQNELAKLNASAKNSANADWQEITIGGNKYRINMTTGEKQLLGSASSDSGSSDISKYLGAITNYLTPPTNTKDTGFVADTPAATPASTVSGYNPYGFSTQENLDAFNKSIGTKFNPSAQLKL